MHKWECCNRQRRFSASIHCNFTIVKQVLEMGMPLGALAPSSASPTPSPSPPLPSFSPPSLSGAPAAPSFSNSAESRRKGREMSVGSTKVLFRCFKEAAKKPHLSGAPTSGAWKSFMQAVKFSFIESDDLRVGALALSAKTAQVKLKNSLNKLRKVADKKTPGASRPSSRRR